jgi:hypothetical protein
MAGRGSFIESFPLFGYELERLRRPCSRKSWPMLLALREGGKVRVAGFRKHTQPI